MIAKRFALLPVCLAVALPCALLAQVSTDRLVRAAAEPRNWLTYSGSYLSQRHSQLREITPANVGNLEQKWIFQAESLQSFSATPLVVDGVMYVTQPPNDIVALDARNGRVFWVYHYAPAPGRICCRGLVNRGVAIHGDTLYMATVDAHLVAVDAKNGELLWDAKVGEAKSAYAMTLAPLVVKDTVIVGVAGAEYGIRGYIAAYDVKTGKEAWKAYTIPGPGEPGHDTWPADGWEHGGASVWTTGSYDPELNLTYWGIGNPGPDFNAAQREGDNLYSDSVIALDADTGKLKWHFQFTPNDPYDYDSTQIPVLVDANWNGTPRKLMLWGNRNGFFYVLDRATGRFLLGRPFTKVNWASGLNPVTGRPILTPQPPGQPTFPGPAGATNWYSPSYSPRTGLFYLSAWENYSTIFAEGERVTYREGQNFTGGNLRQTPGTAPMPLLGRGVINTWHEGAPRGVVLAIDPMTGDQKWKFEMHDVTTSGILTTATDLLFTGGREGYFHALDARTGTLLWKVSVGGEVAAAPISYEVDGHQYVAIAAGHALFAYALR